MRTLEGPGSEQRLRRLQERFRRATPSRKARIIAWDHFWLVTACGMLFALTYFFTETSLDFGSPFIAARHFVAIGSCETASYVGLAPARRGEAGYWAKNDRDRDGIACEWG